MNNKIHEKLNLMDRSWLDVANSRFSLRIPQKEALEILAYAMEHLSKDLSLEENLAEIQKLHDRFSDFHFDFPSLCFSIATWVGKTRLMGAMIWWLYKVKKYKNFFVVAPNLTIYEKLVKDFTYWSPKYVFNGVSDFDAANPRIIDGNNYSQINTNDLVQSLQFKEFEDEVTINVFNISKFNSSKETTKIKKLSEYIGTSYFSYLQSLPDLVVLMDESHRYRAESSSQAINELKPVLGLEFTATPYFQKKTESKGKLFENIAYEYNLANAIRDGYVKIPAVATRRNFDDTISDDEKDFIKLQDGIHIHENTKLDLTLYAQNRWVKPVKPFILISAIDQAHAQKLEDIIKSDRFFGWHYQDKVIKVISGWKAEEKDEAIRMLLSVEDADNPIEIVIQVMMLKEGWDVNNLYTIVPLRASASDTLTEQTLWRWLRLPYWIRTWDEAVDRLTIVAHWEYEKIVAIANDPNSLVHNVISIDDRSWFARPRQLVLNSNCFDNPENLFTSNDALKEAVNSWKIEQADAINITSELRKIIHDAVKSEEIWIVSSTDLRRVDIQESIQKRIIEKTKVLGNTQPKLNEAIQKMGIESLVSSAEQATIYFIEEMISWSIDIPEVAYNYWETHIEFSSNFRIDTRFIQSLPPLHGSEIIIKDLVTNEVTYFERPQIINYDWTLEDYFADIIMQINELDYSTYSGFIYDNAQILADSFREKFSRESEEVLLAWVAGLKSYFYKQISSQIRSPEVMKIHHLNPEIELIRGFRTIKATDFDTFSDWWLLDYNSTGFEKKNIRNLVFKWFRKCVSKYVKFDSDSERVLSVILEEDWSILKWMKPPVWVFKILYRVWNTSAEYLPDFIVETKDTKYIIEVKAENEIDDTIVQAKSEASTKWCNDVNSLVSGKKWKYILLPHNELSTSRSLDYLLMVWAC